ncbi:hypothetical protein JSY14_08715 [Brachybacterium sp. EF45031]|uniref:DUF6541 family protein n=1 Tax=Brachybacterium sillae TaxID=2810536 RepID=UPI00217D3A1D|nr:DUF6541 family protein [Brachybacterium sillae]MCS6712097.1 hypothetical protein [Brachybacterium sillae]
MDLVLTLVLSVVAACAVLTLPGLPLVAALRPRPLTAVALLPAVSTGIVTVAAELGSREGIPWTPASPLVLGLLIALPAWVVRWISARHRRDVPRGGSRAVGPDRRVVQAAILGGVGLGAATVITRALLLMGRIDQVSQTYDAIFHLNAVRWVLEHQDASAWTVGAMTRLPGRATYYPAAWHQLASLVAQLNTGDIVLASNVLMLMLGALVWPIGAVALVRTGTTAGPVGLFITGALAGIALTFPQWMMSWGLLLPYLLGTSLLPALMLMMLQVVGHVPVARQRLSAAALIVLTPLVVLAAVASHPQTVFSALTLGVPVLVWLTLARLTDLLWDRHHWVRRSGALLRALLPAVVAIGAAQWVWPAFRVSRESAIWEANTWGRHAVWQGLSLAGNMATPVTVVLVLVIVAGAALLLWGKGRWLGAGFAAAVAMYWLAAAGQDAELRYELTGPWYSDIYRIAALLPLLGIPLIGAGADSLVHLVRQWRPRLRLPWPAVVAAAVALVLAGTLSPAARVNDDPAGRQWASEDLLTPDERALLEQLPQLVPEDAIIATNAWNGSSLAYAIGDRQVLNTFVSFEAEPRVHLLNARLDEAATDPEVCLAAQQLGVDYALDFGPDELWDKRATYTGLNEIAETGAAREVARVGDASLWEILPCRGPDGSMIG